MIYVYNLSYVCVMLFCTFITLTVDNKCKFLLTHFLDKILMLFEILQSENNKQTTARGAIILWNKILMQVTSYTVRRFCYCCGSGVQGSP